MTLVGKKPLGLWRTAWIMLAAEVLLFLMLLMLTPGFAAKVGSMITANHLGGRLAFIAVGLENGLSPPVLIPIILLYNSTYLLLMYSLFIYFSGRIGRFPVVGRYAAALKAKAERRRKLVTRWNLWGIALFVWIPLPWTGAVIGAWLAHIEGYPAKDTLLTVLPAMWVGVISWTLWFDELYEFIERFGKGRTMIVTIGLLVLPLLLYAFDLVGARLSRPPKGRD